MIDFDCQCTRCLSEISFKTDPASTDYVIEAGATRNFMALKLAEEQALREVEAEKEEEKTNPMKVRAPPVGKLLSRLSNDVQLASQ